MKRSYAWQTIARQNSSRQMTERSTHRLAGLEADNLLAFLALLGILRTLENARPKWHARVSWTVDAPPVRPMLTVAKPRTGGKIVAAIVEGLNDLGRHHDFGGIRDLKMSREEATERLRDAAAGDRYVSNLWASLISDAALRDKGKMVEAEPTPLCLLSGQGHMHFMSRLASVPRDTNQETERLRETIFGRWTRRDTTHSFRWDPQEDVRYALRATDPTDTKTKKGTQHGANRLAAVGLSALTVVPRNRAGKVQLSVVGGEHHDGFAFTWPIWRHPVSLAGIRSLLGHTRLDNAATRDALGVVELRRARQIQVGRYKNVTRAETVY